MPPKQRRKDPKNFWQEWGVYLIIAAIIVAGALALRFLRPKQIELAPPELYQLFFTQSHSIELQDKIIADVTAAQERIDLATPGLDVEGIATALIEAQGRGVEVRLLQDAVTQDDPDVAATSAHLEEAGISIALADGTLAGAYIIVDQNIVWAGSWDISRRGLEQHSSAVLRFDLTEEASNFRAEFTEMFEQGAFGANSPRNTPHPFVTIYDGGSISIYYTPEDDPLSETLQTLATVESEILVLTEGLDDPRLRDRLVGESTRTDVQTRGLFEAQGYSTEEMLQALKQAGAHIRLYRGSERLAQNVMIVDSWFVVLFSQPLVQQSLSQNDGYVIILRDRAIGTAFRNEFLRLFELSQDWP